MSETTQAADFDATINFLKQDLASVDLAVAITYIEQWENQLQGTDIFQNLMELKQAILDGNIIELETLLRDLGENTTAFANDVRGMIPQKSRPRLASGSASESLDYSRAARTLAVAFDPITVPY